MRRTRRFLKTGSGIWTPAQLSNQVFDLDALSISGKSDGDTVSSWDDSFSAGVTGSWSGNGIYKTAGNGMATPSVYLPGSNPSGFDPTTWNPPGFGDFFFCIVLRPEITNNSNYTIGTVSSNSSFGMAAGTNSMRWNMYNYMVITDLYVVGDFSGDTYVFCGREGTNSKLEANTLTAQKTELDTVTSARVSLGKRATIQQFWFQGWVSRFLMLGYYPSASELTKLRAYITSEYGIATS